ncbi:hypothetical protein GmHk_05G013274 [Glycine max]|nr:hypothetical protein GmHk_05G013274 [Glycine max]
MILDASTGGTMMSKSPEEAIVIIDSIAASDYQSHHDRAPTQRKECNSSSKKKLLTQQIEVLTKQIGQLPQQCHQGGPQKTHQAHQVQQILRCDFCGDNHQNGHCSTLGDGKQEEKAHYLQNQARPQQNFQGSYQGYRGGSGSNQPYGRRPQNSSPTNTSCAGPSNNSYGGSSSRGPQQHQAQPDRMSKMEDTLTQFMQVSISNQKNTNASIKNLEVWVGELTKQLSEHGSGSFLANTQVNPKEHYNLITTRWGNVVGLKDNDEKKNKEGVEKENKKNDEVVTSGKVEEKVVSEEEKKKSNDQIINKGKAIVNHPPIEHLPYPHAPSKKDKEMQYKCFIDIFKRLQITISFFEALEQMPTYAKFMKDLLTKKKRIMDDEIVNPQPQQ